ncbi:MAG: 30S ribosomal protein S20 [Clostridia bacterium]|nr:30S ribosomal protein S20 [Clostridia bacterium]
MPNIKSAKKRMKVTATKTLRNKRVKSAMKTDIKKFDAAAQTGAAETNDLFRKATGAVDKAAVKGIIHKNKANRKKSQLAKRLNQAAQ